MQGRGGFEREQPSPTPTNFDPSAYWKEPWTHELEPNHKRKAQRIGRRIRRLYFGFEQIQQAEQVNGPDLTDRIYTFYLGQGALSNLKGFAPDARKLFALLCNFNASDLDTTGAIEFLQSDLSAGEIFNWLRATSYKFTRDKATRPLLLGT